MASPHIGKVAIVTGASRNLGRATAEMLAAEGTSVVVHYHDSARKAEADQVAHDIREQGGEGNAVVEQADLTKVQEVEGLFERTVERFGRLDILVNTSGMVIKKPLVEYSESEYDRLFAVNAKAAFFCMREAAKRMENEGRIISVVTTILAATMPMYAAYAGSKAPVEDFTRALAKEIAPRGITVNAIAPGPLNTSFYHSAETPDSVARVTGANLLGEVRDVVPLIRFLASPEARWITAQTIFINGGYMAR
ncbi:MAG TPA: SDR family oxidoreductase [Rhodanobacteraceae bacterium]